MNSKQAKQIDIVDFLQLNHINFSKQVGNDYWYYSPYRDEKTPSFKVDREKNLWYDHGTGEGGTIIDLVLKIEGCSVREALAILDKNSFGLSFKNKLDIQDTLFDTGAKKSSFTAKQKKPKQEIIKTGVLKNIALLDYIKSRGIDEELAKKYLLEIYYRYNDKNYFAIAFQNDSQAYEIRSKYFKGTIGTKDITTIKGLKQEKVVIFEGFFDFLSALTYYKKERFYSDVIILNSVALLPNILEQLKAYKEVFLFLDNDKTGNRAKSLIKDNFGGKIIDKSSIYAKYNDFNEFLQ